MTTGLKRLYELLEASGPFDQTAYNQWRRAHVTNRWVTGEEEEPQRLLITDKKKAYLLFDVLVTERAERTALVLEVGTVATVRDQQILKLAYGSELVRTKPITKQLYQGESQVFEDLARRGDSRLENVIRKLRNAMGIPFMNPAVEPAAPDEFLILSGDTSEQTVVLAPGWVQRANSSIIDSAVPLLVHSVETDTEAAGGSILIDMEAAEIPEKPRQLKLTKINTDIWSRFDVLTQWDLLGIGALPLKPISFDPLFEPYLIYSVKAVERDILSAYEGKLNDVLASTRGEEVVDMVTEMKPNQPIVSDLKIFKEPGKLYLKSEGTSPIATLQIRPEKIRVKQLNKASRVANPTPLSRPCYAALVWAWWSGYVKDPTKISKFAQEGFFKSLGISVEDWDPSSKGLERAVSELISLKEVERKPPPRKEKEPEKEPEVRVPGQPEAPKAVTIVNPELRVMRNPTTLQAEKEWEGRDLHSLTVDFIENQTVMSRIVAFDIPLRRANVIRYPNLPYDNYYAIWYRSRGTGYYPKDSKIAVPLSAYDSPPSILIRLRGRIRLTIQATATSAPSEHLFAYDLTQERLGDAYNIIFSFDNPPRYFIFGLAQDRAGFGALESISVGEGSIGP